MTKAEPTILRYVSPTSDRNEPWGIVSIAVKLAAVVLPIGLFVTPSFISPRPGAEKEFVRITIGATGPIVTSIKAFQLHTSHLPATLRDLSDKPAGESKWQGPYIEDPTKLKDPWGEDYQYRCLGMMGRPYDLWSKGADKISVSADDISG